MCVFLKKKFQGDPARKKERDPACTSSSSFIIVLQLHPLSLSLSLNSELIFSNISIIQNGEASTRDDHVWYGVTVSKVLQKK